jgi:hypothetical protein
MWLIINNKGIFVFDLYPVSYEVLDWIWYYELPCLVQYIGNTLLRPKSIPYFYLFFPGNLLKITFLWYATSTNLSYLDLQFQIVYGR